MKIMSRREAISAGEMFYFTGEQCKRGHVAKRRVSNMSCEECVAHKKSEYDRRYYQNHSNEVKDRVNRWIENNKERRQQYMSDYYQQHANDLKARSTDRYHENRDEIREKQNEHRRINAERINKRNTVNVRKRQAAKLQAIPAWYDQNEALAIYEEARRATEETGIPHVVDHVVPLQGKLVCGLHVAENLQVLTAEENGRKGSKFTP